MNEVNRAANLSKKCARLFRRRGVEVICQLCVYIISRNEIRIEIALKYNFKPLLLKEYSEKHEGSYLFHVKEDAGVNNCDNVVRTTPDFAESGLKV